MSDPEHQKPLPGPYASFCVVCEHALIDRNDSVSIISVVDAWLIRSLPFTRDFCIAIGIKGLPHAPAGYPVRIDVVRESDGKVLFTEEKPQREGAYLRFMPQFTFDQAGQYWVLVRVDQQIIGQTAFDIRLAPTRH